MRALGALLGLGLLLTAWQAEAAALPFTGTLSVVIATLPPISVPASGSGVATVLGGSHLTSVQLAGGTFATAVSVPVTDPALYPFNGITAAFVNGAGSLALGGPMGVKGSANICLFAACTASPPANVEIPFTLNGTRGVGLGGGPIKKPGGILNVTVIGAPWTVGTATIMGGLGGGFASAMGFVHGPASAGASSAAASSGALRLVTPIVVQTSIASSGTIAAFGILDLHFVPEPGTMLLVASGFAGLALVGRRRMSR